MKVLVVLALLALAVAAGPAKKKTIVVHSKIDVLGLPKGFLGGKGGPASGSNAGQASTGSTGVPKVKLPTKVEPGTTSAAKVKGSMQKLQKDLDKAKKKLSASQLKKKLAGDMVRDAMKEKGKMGRRVAKQIMKDMNAKPTMPKTPAPQPVVAPKKEPTSQIPEIVTPGGKRADGGKMVDGVLKCPHKPKGAAKSIFKTCPHSDGTCCHALHNACCEKGWICGGTPEKPTCTKIGGTPQVQQQQQAMVPVTEVVQTTPTTPKFAFCLPKGRRATLKVELRAFWSLIEPYLSNLSVCAPNQKTCIPAELKAKIPAAAVPILPAPAKQLLSAPNC